VRVLACVLLAACASSAAAAPPAPACPETHGSLTYVRGGTSHAVSLLTCADRIAGRAPANRFPRVAGVTATGGTPGRQRLYVHGHLVFSGWETGPLVPLKLSGDGRWLFFFVDEYGAESAIADGVPVDVVSTRGGAVHDLGRMLPYPDYLTWCGGEIVYTPGTDRVVIDGKRLMAAAPPGWRPHSLWNDRGRTFGSPACEPGHEAVAVLTQHTSKIANFFATRWRLWRVGLDGSRHLLDVPPPGWADEQPTWSPDGKAIAFVRERNGYGRIMVRSNGRLYGPVAQLGYAMGYYGHHDWGLAWRR
jgi:hypothetical protein